MEEPGSNVIILAHARVQRKTASEKYDEALAAQAAGTTQEAAEARRLERLAERHPQLSPDEMEVLALALTLATK